MTTTIIPPNIQAAMTGAVKCEKGDLQTTLFYEDGTTEPVRTSDIPDRIDWENWFSIVGTIQSLRKAVVK